MDQYQSSLSMSQINSKDMSQISILNKPKVPNSKVNK
jgi:hypothetical protein